MIALPDTYKIGTKGKHLNKKSFLHSSLSTKEKRRIRETLLKAVLTHQIGGEGIPSVINEDYRCEILMKIDLYLSDLKHKDFIAQAIQPLFKPYVILRLMDTSGSIAYSFAHKRLNKNDSDTIVIAHSYCTDPSTGDFNAIQYANLVNRSNKRDLYIEAMTKAFLIDNPKIFIGAESLLNSKVWYHGDSTLQLFHQLTHLLTLKQQKNTAKSNAAKATLNNQIKTAIDQIKR